MPVPLITRAVAPAMKFVPVSVTGTFVPGTPADGLIDVSVGGCSGGGPAGVIWNVAAPEVVPSGFVTVTGTGPAVPPNVTDAVSVPKFTNVVATGTPPNLIVAPDMKFEPDTVKAIVVLTTPDGGVRAEIAGGGNVTFNVTAFDDPPPGTGFTT
jgi:hypothetical protein